MDEHTELRDRFARFAQAASTASGRPVVFAGAVAVIGLWAVTGPLLGFSNTWQLIINTATTIVTFLMVFLIQNTQNRDSRALHLKLDEVLRAIDGASDRLIDIEEATEEEAEQSLERYQRLGLAARNGERLPVERAGDGREASSSRPQ